MMPIRNEDSMKMFKQETAPSLSNAKVRRRPPALTITTDTLLVNAIPSRDSTPKVCWSEIGSPVLNSLEAVDCDAGGEWILQTGVTGSPKLDAQEMQKSGAEKYQQAKLKFLSASTSASVESQQAQSLEDDGTDQSDLEDEDAFWTWHAGADGTPKSYVGDNDEGSTQDTDEDAYWTWRTGVDGTPKSVQDESFAKVQRFSGCQEVDENAGEDMWAWHTGVDGMPKADSSCQEVDEDAGGDMWTWNTGVEGIPKAHSSCREVDEDAGEDVWTWNTGVDVTPKADSSCQEIDEDAGEDMWTWNTGVDGTPKSVSEEKLANSVEVNKPLLPARGQKRRLSEARLFAVAPLDLEFSAVKRVEARCRHEDAFWFWHTGVDAIPNPVEKREEGMVDDDHDRLVDDDHDDEDATPWVSLMDSVSKDETVKRVRNLNVTEGGCPWIALADHLPQRGWTFNGANIGTINEK